MQECNIEIIINGEKITFNSYKELDGFLYDHQDSLMEVSDGDLFTLSVDLQKVAIDKFDEQVLKWKELNKKTTPKNIGGVDVIDEMEVHTTTAIRFAGHPNDITQPAQKPFDTNEYKIKLYEKFKAEDPSRSEPLIQQLIENKLKENKLSGERSRTLGTTVHELIEDVLLDKYNPANKYKLLQNNLASWVSQVASPIKRILQERYPGGVFRIEPTIFSEKLNPEFTKAIRTSKRLVAYLDQIKNDPDKRKEIVNLQKILNQTTTPVEFFLQGMIDTLVIDKDGRINIFDFKTSFRPYEEWNQDKLVAYRIQIQFYAAMLRQAGFEVGDVGLIPILLKEDSTGKITGSLSGLTFNTMVKFCYITDPENIMANKVIPNNTKIQVRELTDLNNKMSKVFGGQTINAARTREQMKVTDYINHYVHEISPSDPEYNPNVKQYVLINKLDYYRGVDSKAKRVILTDDNKEKVVEEYLHKLAEYQAERFQLLANAIDISSKGDLGALNRYLYNNIYGDNEKQLFTNAILPYIRSGYSLNMDPVAIQNGIFVFTKNGVSEVVAMTDQFLFQKVPINKQSNILGQFKDDDEIDFMHVLDSSYGSLLSMKMMCFIADTPMFTSNKVQSIKVINFQNGTSVEHPLHILIDNWNELVRLSKDDTLKTLGRQKILTPEQALLNRANDALSLVNFVDNNLRKEIHSINLDKDTIAETTKKITSILKEIKQKYANNISIKTLINQPIGKVYLMLSKTLLSLKGIYLIQEKDVGQYISARDNDLGSMMTPLYSSNSTLLRNLEKITSFYYKDIGNYVYTNMLTWQKLIAEAYEEWKQSPKFNYSSVIGKEFVHFRKFFRESKPGQYDRRLILKSPEDPFFNDLPKSKALLTWFLETMNEMKYPNPELRDRMLIAAETGADMSYYQVPLIRASTIEQIFNLRNFKDIFQTTAASLKRHFDKNLTELSDIEASNRYIKTFLDEVKALDQDSLENAYFSLDSQEREEIIEKNDSIYETSLDIIMTKLLVENARVEMSKSWLPVLTSFRYVLQFMQDAEGNSLNDIIKVTEKFITANVFKQNIMDQNLIAFNQILAVLRSAVSTIAIGFDIGNTFRDSITGIVAESKYILNNDPRVPIRLDGEGEKSKYLGEIASSLKDVIAMTAQLNNPLSQLQLFNGMYQIIDYTPSKIAVVSKTNRFGLTNISADLAFLTSNLPDVYHRTAILYATLKHIGAWDAHTINDEGELKYDMSKDKRYEILFKYHFDRSAVPISELKEYDIADSLYKHNLNVFQSTEMGKTYKYGDKFEIALTPEEINNVSYFSDTLFGSYSPDNKALVQKTFLGAMFFQFKTFGLNQLQQNVRKQGNVNIVKPTIAKDENGETVYEVVCTEEEFRNNGGNAIVYLPESQVTEEMKVSGRAKPRLTYQGAVAEGALRSILHVPSILFKWNQEDLNRYWNKPHVKANILGSIWDNLFMALLQMLVVLLYGKDNVDTIDEQAWFTQWTYGVLSGVTKNGMIWEVVQGLYGDGTPPMISSLQRYFSTMGKIIHGDENVFYALANTFGATSDFSSIFLTEE